MKHTVIGLLVPWVITSLLLGCHPRESKGQGIFRERIRSRIQDRIKDRQLDTEETNLAGESRTITVQSTLRTYLLYRPKAKPQSNEPPMPLVIGFHGGRSNPQRFAQTTRFNAPAERERFSIAYPAGIDQRWNDGRDVPGLPTQDDVAFVSALIDDIQKIQNIDRRRIYATGISNGGFMTQRLACELNHKIAAFASVAATMPVPQSLRCRPGRKVPVLFINSPDDRFIPWQGGAMSQGEGGTILSTPQVVDFWRKNNRTSTTRITPLPTRTGVEDGTQTLSTTSQGTSLHSEVTLVRIDGGGHAWPGGSRQPEWLIGKATQKLDGSQFIWDFFRRHSLPLP